MTPDTLVYICNLEWCDEGYHVEPPEMFPALYTKADIEEFGGDDGHLIPLNEGELRMGYRFPCGTWWAKDPRRMTYAEAMREFGMSDEHIAASVAATPGTQDSRGES